MTETNDKKREIKLIALDIDGTTLNSKHELTPRLEKALRAAAAQGIKIVFATGKTRHSLEYLREKLKIQMPGIFLQGLITYNAAGEVVRQLVLPKHLSRQVLTFGEDRGFIPVVYSGMRMFARHQDKEVAKQFEAYHEPPAEFVTGVQNLLEDLDFNKIILVGEPRAVKSLRWQLTHQLGSSARVIQAGLMNMLEVLPAGGSKGAALELLLRDMKISPENMLAAGDAENDLEMVKLAGIGVAMGNAEASLKAVADYVCPTNDEDGLVEVLEKFVLKQPEPKPQPVPEMPASKPAVEEPKAEQKATDDSKKEPVAEVAKPEEKK